MRAARTKSKRPQKAIGGYPLVLDVSDQKSVASAVDTVEHELGAISLLVNNAGIIEPGGPAWERDAAEWWRVFEVNVLGAFLFMQAVIPRMIERGKGRVINISSQSAHSRIDSAPTYSAYMGSKAALTRMTEAIAYDTRPYGVTVFAMRPGSVRSALVDQILNDMSATADNFPESTWTLPVTAGEIEALMATGALDSLVGVIFIKIFSAVYLGAMLTLIYNWTV